MFDKRLLKQIDWFTILLVFGLVAFGLISIASIMATPFDGGESGISDYLEKLNLQYVQKQAVNFMIGFAAFLVVVVIDYHFYKVIIKYVYIANIGLLGFLLTVEKVRGIHGWFVIEQLNRNIQPAELCKITIIIMLSYIISESMDRNDGKLRSFKSVAMACILLAVPTGLVLIQPDFGTAFVYICIFVFMLFMARISWGYILAAFGALAAGLPLAYLFVLSEEQKWRIKVLLNPELDLKKYGYNVYQSKISIGAGQLYGKGFFTEGTLAQLRFVPERHTDFIFAGIVEGVGFVGGVILIATFFVLMFRWLYIAMKTKDNFGSCLVTGLIGMLLAHVVENVGMTMGIMPVTGIPLPFISYGGSNLLTNMIGVGIVVNVWMRRPPKKQPLRDRE